MGSHIADKVNSRDYMYYDEENQKSVWLYMFEDWTTEADTDGYDVLTFAGGLFAAVLADSREYSEYDRVRKGIGAVDHTARALLYLVETSRILNNSFIMNL